jgi:uncharacterized protein YbjT (DUF2867 family)
MKTIVFGATGGTGRAVTQVLLAHGHGVAAFARQPTALAPLIGQVIVAGDVMDEASVARSLNGQDAVVVSLGNSQNPFAMLLGAKRTTPANICEAGTRNIVRGMQMHGIKRVIVVSSFGVGDTKEQASFMNKLFFQMFLREHMADKEKQEVLVKSSGLDWTLVQPVALVDQPVVGRYMTSNTGAIGGSMISRADLATFIVQELEAPCHKGLTVTLSGDVEQR